MNIILIGAGRGSRIMPYSKDSPKCFTEVNGKRILDYALDAFDKNEYKNINFIGGYLIDVVQKQYPQFTFFHNDDWENNNILASLFYAEDAMTNGFISSYSDILFVPEIIEKLKKSPHDITLAIDTDWKNHYASRTQHPMDDGEKVLCNGNGILKVSRLISNDDAYGEFIGIAKFSPKGAAQLKEFYYQAKKEFSGKPFKEAKEFKKAYFIHLLQYMIEKGVKIHKIDNHGGYYEIDTVEDLQLVQEAFK
tara:strand:+ start:1462 stop:2211 length:750 start_codon:yes stop_codon:yes gene_type:complete